MAEIPTETTVDGAPGTVLFVDDERNILRAVERSLKTVAGRLITVDSAEEAIEVLGQDDVDILISDYRMPRRDGLSLLRDVKRTFPTVHRIVLSGYVDDPEILRALGSGLATSFFAKPWDDTQFRAKIAHVLDVRRILQNRGLLEIVSSVDRLATLPPLYLELSRAIDEDRSADEIALCVAQDPSAAAAVLHMANSAFYGTNYTGSITTLKDAVLTLGLAHLKEIMLGLTLISEHQWASTDFEHILKIFVHSLVLSYFVRAFHQRLHRTGLPKHLQSAAILHDIGKIILIKYYPDRFRRIIQEMGASELTFYDAEIALGHRGQTHSEIGAYFLDLWNMPDVLTHNALFHHSPDTDVTGNEAAQTIKYLNILLNTMELAPDPVRVDLSTYVRQGVSAEFLSEFKKEAVELIHENYVRFRRWFDPMR